MKAKPKKHFGQHFLRDKNIARRICDSLLGFGNSWENLLEIGPGEGVLTEILSQKYQRDLYLVEIDQDLVPALKQRFPQLEGQIIHDDFLKLPLNRLFKSSVGIIGNFPYNISSQILFKVIENKAMVQELVGMFQREVARRIVSVHGNKDYGILSVWVQLFYSVEYLFTVNEGSFFPPPKVKSAVIRLERKKDADLPVREELLLKMIKEAFGQRRKTLRNALSAYKPNFAKVKEEILSKRAEQLAVNEFVELGEKLLTP